MITKMITNHFFGGPYYQEKETPESFVGDVHLLAEAFSIRQSLASFETGFDCVSTTFSDFGNPVDQSGQQCQQVVDDLLTPLLGFPRLFLYLSVKRFFFRAYSFRTFCYR